MDINNPHRIDDPRDTLSKMHRRELVEAAQAHGQKDINENMAADDIRNILRSRGLSRIQPNRSIKRLGAIGQEKTFPRNGAPKPPTINQDEMREFLEWKAKQGQEQKPIIAELGIVGLRRECKARGIKFSRRDNMIVLRAKLNGQDSP